MNWKSHHPVGQKIGLIKTLFYRADTLITSEEGKKKEKDKIKNALRRCQYPEWALREGEKKSDQKKKSNSREGKEHR